MQSSIKPGQVWLDTEGNRIQAHGGSVHFENGYFYWYGENKEKTIPGSGIWHWGISCYKSKDLYNWENLGLIIPPDLEDEESPLHPKKQMDRPHIIFNERSKKYLCWIKVMGDSSQETTVLQADSLLGPYEIVNRSFRPLGMSAGDFDLVVDPHDGKAYYYFERVHSELICADLTDDYKNVTGYYSTHFPNGYPPFVREAPAYFQRGKEHYLITSGTTHYFPNQSEAAIAATYHGPWTILGNPHPGDGAKLSYRSQISCIFKHPNKRDLYIAMADRWLPNVSADLANKANSAVENIFNPDVEPERKNVPEFLKDIIDNADTSIADYVWLPIRFEGNIPTIDWYDEWSIEDFA